MVYLSCERDTNMGGSINPEYPIAGMVYKGNPIKMDDLGVSFQETSISVIT